MPRHDDVALVAAARGGSDAAFARIVDRYQGPLRSFLVRVSGSRADADEIAQEAFLTAWTRLRGLREADRLKSWLFSIAWRKGPHPAPLHGAEPGTGCRLAGHAAGSRGAAR